MFNPDRAQLRRILVHEMGYSGEAVDDFLDRFGPLHDDLAPSFQGWLQDRRVVDVVADGVSLVELMRLHNTNYLSALMSLNDLLMRPLTDEERAALRSFLTHPLILR